MKFQQFNTEFFKSNKEIKTFDQKSIYVLNNDTIAKFILSDRGYKDHFTGYMVTIINKKHGIVDETFFSFEEYFTNTDRVDKRIDDQPNQQIYGWADQSAKKVEWYIAIPSQKAINKMVKTMLDYIQYFN